MTNPKIDKVNSDIAKSKAKISEYQTRLRSLERQKIELENESFINIIRSEKISDAELNTLMQSLRKKEPRLTTAFAEEITVQEDTLNADQNKK